MFRIMKSVEVESGHMLSKHKGRCRFPHGHTRKIEVYLAAEHLDSNDMVCDFKLLKNILLESCDKYDHAMCVNFNTPLKDAMPDLAERIIYFGCDPTTEAMAQRIYADIRSLLKNIAFDNIVILEKVRVWETSSTYAEYERPESDRRLVGGPLIDTGSGVKK